jgi:thiamine-monophosphate kinase
MKLGEFELINRLKNLVPLKNKEVLVSVGDDTAVVKKGNGFLLLTTDALVDGVHFKVEWEELLGEELFFSLGKKLINICASDVASMGGAPTLALVNLALTDETNYSQVEALYEGLGQECRELSVALVGGDTVKSKNLLFDCTLIGESRKGYMLRSKAKPGELVAVTGTLGDSRGGLELLNLKLLEPSSLIKKFLQPKARIEEGTQALKLGVKCATDVSDGLLFNAYTIAESSKTQIELFSNEIPISRELIEKFGKEKALEFALYGGEDYELIITFEPKLQSRLEELGFKVIGEVKEGRGILLDGKSIKPKGYDHFKGGKP